MTRTTLLVVPLLITIAASLLWLRLLNAPLQAIVHGGTGPPSVVLLHGYGSRAEDWFQFEQTWSLPANTQLIYPQAPLRGPLSGSRGWWWLNLNGHTPAGEVFADYSKIHPGGIEVASRLVRNYLKSVNAPIILGGFSQGAMTSAEIAFHSDQDLAGLILLSGTTVDEEGWAEHFAGRRDLPIFIAHGRNDAVLPFERMERFQARLKAFGMNVTWLPFDGDHGIPKEVVAGMSAFIQKVFQLQFPAGRD
ncbi:MAG TPA: alpha/beta fold hydrolase [Vicinamibacterales bacterium]|nr:alpha/beta fold hydrolase [Vicinamibacterales bacterium]